MENVNDHSKAKLALAILTSPGAAFEEILRRRLLGSALVIVALAGIAAAVPWIIQAANGTPLDLYMLGRANPIAWLGLCMLYAFALQKLLKWLGTTAEYVPLLTMMGWSQVALVLSGLFQSMAVYGEVGRQAAMGQAGYAGAMLFSLWYVALMGPALMTLTGAPKARGILSYAVVELAAVIGLNYTYTSKLVAGFGNTLPGVARTAGTLASLDQLPWVGAAAVGLVIGLWQIGKYLEWTPSKIKVNAAAAGLVGLALFGGYSHAMKQNTSLSVLAQAQAFYDNGHYAEAARKLESVQHVTKDNTLLLTDIANVLYMAREDSGSLEYIRKARDIIKRQSPNPDKQSLAALDVYEGIALDASGQYDKALAAFGSAAKRWPEFREPPIRMAITYDRLGKYDEAIKSGNRAVLKLGSRSAVVWVALLDAFANIGDKKQAAAAMANLAGNDKELAKRVGSTPDDWKDAVSKLTRKDLKSPLEAEPAPKPEKATKPAEKKSDKSAEPRKK